ncbi:hypothetical protein GW17_00004670 [Ensete ventricosum]|nr:hypothetical protein GW17_00004670 [Ensete ventricosum]RZR81343.1 hypothetical protein BHM03_00007534 [Ensete ventricosum]
MKDKGKKRGRGGGKEGREEADKEERGIKMAGDGKEGKEEEVPPTAAVCSSKEEEDSANQTTGKGELPRVRSEEYDETLT